MAFMDPNLVLPSDIAFHINLLEKQLKRVAELGQKLVLLEQREEMSTLVENVNRELAYLRRFLSLPVHDVTHG